MSDDMGDWEEMMKEPQDKARWINPMDMGLFDSKAQKNCDDLEEKLSVCEKHLETCQSKLEEMSQSNGCLNKSIESSTLKAPVEEKIVNSDIFFKRHVRQLINKLYLDAHQDSHLKLEVFLSSDEIATLLKFVNQESSIPAVDVDNILSSSSFIRSVDYYETSPLIDEIKEQLISLKDPLLVVLMSISLVYLIILVFRRFPPFKVFLLVLTVSLIWHWFHLYKEAVAKKESKMLQNLEIPAECRPGEMTWYQTAMASVRGLTSSVDKCEEYHKAIHVNPLTEVNPLSALVDLVIKLLLHPITKLGDAVGKMFTGLLEVVPALYKIPVLILFFVIILFVMILLFGYRIRLPFFLGEIGPAAVSEPSSNIQALEHKIKELQTALSHVQPQPPPLLLDSRPNVQVLHGIEEIKPLGYDIQVKSHDEHTPIMRQQLRTDSIKNQEIVPVKGRVMSQPDIFKTTGVVNVDDKVEVDGSIGIFKDSDDVNEVVDELINTSITRSNSFPQSPSKNLCVKVTDSPRTTKFDWIEVEKNNLNELEEKIVETGPANDAARNTGGESDFLNKVVEIFDKTKDISLDKTGDN